MWVFIQKYFGWRNWAVFQYNSILENLFVFFYIAFRIPDHSAFFLLKIFLFIFFSLFSTTYGYLINDLADVELDRIHGKANTFADVSSLKAAAVTGFFFLLSTVFAFPFWLNRWFLILWASWFLISSFYSLPPLRLKERGKLGLLLVVSAQRLLPVLLVFSAFNFSYGWEIAGISFYVFLRGLSSDINHQLIDYQNDLKTRTKTFAVTTGHETVQKIFRWVLELEKIFLFLILAFFLTILHPRFLLAYYITAFLSVFYLIAYLSSHYLLWKRKIPVDVNPFQTNGKNIFQLLHHSYPSVILPLGLNVAILPLNWFYILLLLFQMALRRLFSIRVVTQSYVYAILKRNLWRSSNAH